MVPGTAWVMRAAWDCFIGGLLVYKQGSVQMETLSSGFTLGLLSLYWGALKAVSGSPGSAMVSDFTQVLPKLH